MKAADKMKWALELDSTRNDSIGSGNSYLVNGNYSSSGRLPYKGTTDISLAFETAVEAFKESKLPEDRQAIIFFSDGFSQFVDPQREIFLKDYIKGKNLPCTFTVFYNRYGTPIPDELKNMTENIKWNGYSPLNEFSSILRTKGETATYLDELQCVLRRIYIRYMNYTSSPRTIWINRINSN